MADRSVSVKLSADVGQFTQAMGQAAGAAKGVGDALPESKGGFLGNVNKHAGELNALAGTMATVGAVGLAAFGSVAKAAIDWESAFAGVKKTVDDTSTGYAALSDELREMARTLPASHQEIAAVAEAAGQLGVAREDIATFSRTMIALGETTNLSADEAATALARFTAITGSSHDEVGRLGSTLVGLGNNFAATEAEIMHLSLRLAGMGNLVGMTEADIMGLSTAMMAVGINAEAGGTAMSISMSKINDAVLSGNDKLEQFAEVAGMTATEFADAWRNDPSAALTQFIEGLGQVAEAGGNTNQVLRDLGITNQRERDAMLRLAGASGIVADAFAMANEEYRKGSALSDEAALRYETAASRIAVAWNQVKDAAISIGAAVGPSLATMAEAIGAVATWVGQLPAGLLTTTAAVIGVSAAALVAGAGFIRLTTGIASTVASLTALTAASPRAAAGLSLVTAAMGPLMWGAMAFAGLGILQNTMLEIPKDTAKAERGLKQFANTAGNLSKELDGFFKAGDGGFSVEINDMADAIEALSYQESAIARFGSAFANVFGIKDELAVSIEQFEALDDVLASMDADEAAAAFAALKQQMLDAGISAELVDEMFDDYLGTVRDAIPILDGVGAAAAAAAGDVYETADAAEAAAEAHADLADAITAAANAYTSLTGASVDQEEAIAKLDERVKEITQSGNEHMRTLDHTTEAGRKNQDMLNDLINSTMAAAEAELEHADSMDDLARRIDRGKEAFVRAAVAMGMEEKAARDLADQLFEIPPEVRTRIAVDGHNAAITAANNVASAVLRVPTSRQTSFAVAGWVTARDAALSVANAVLAIPTSRTTTVRTTHVSSGIGALSRADGGPIDGWSPHPRADNIPVMATAGEFMHSVAAVDYYGEGFMHAINSRAIPREWVRAIGLADGGSVRPAGSSRPMPAHRIPSTAAAPQVHVAAPSLDGAVLEIPVGPFVAALDRRDRAATVSARVHMKGA